MVLRGACRIGTFGVVCGVFRGTLVLGGLV